MTICLFVVTLALAWSVIMFVVACKYRAQAKNAETRAKFLAEHLLNRHKCDIGLDDPDYGF